MLEALKLNCFDKKYISLHIDKIYKYDTLGYDYNFVVSYVKCKNFAEFWDKYTEFVDQYKYPYNKVAFNKSIGERKNYSELKFAETILNRNGEKARLIHIAIHMMD